MSEIQHEDKCRWWDDNEFCDCGAVEVDRLEKALVAEKEAHAISCRALELMVQELRQILDVPTDRMLPEVARELRAEVERLKEERDSFQRVGIVAGLKAAEAESALTRCRNEALEEAARMAELTAALRDMLALWERVHGTAILGRPTTNAAKKVLERALAAASTDNSVQPQPATAPETNED